jgi:hypothetical protein
LLALELNLSTALKASPANDDCQTWKNKASHYMGGRQQGIALAEAVKDTNGNRSRGLLLRADNESQPSVFDAQYVAIQRFSDTIYQKCRVL